MTGWKSITNTICSYNTTDRYYKDDVKQFNLFPDNDGWNVVTPHNNYCILVFKIFSPKIKVVIKTVLSEFFNKCGIEPIVNDESCKYIEVKDDILEILLVKGVGDDRWLE